MRIIFQFIFWLIYTIYRCKLALEVKESSMKFIINFFIRNVYMIFLSGFSSQQKIDQKYAQQLQKLNRKPVQLILAIKLYRAESPRQLQKQVNKFLAIIGQSIQHITVYIDSRSQQHNENILAILKNDNKNSHVQYRNWSTYIRNQFKLIAEKNSQTPLIINFSRFNEFCNIPYNFFIDAEIGFCPSIKNANSQQFIRCFEKYSQSKQRHGK